MRDEKETPQEVLIRKLGNSMPTLKEIEKAQGSFAKLLNNRLKKEGK